MHNVGGVHEVKGAQQVVEDYLDVLLLEAVVVDHFHHLLEVVGHMLHDEEHSCGILDAIFSVRRQLDIK